ncbi:MAG TPA: HEAT repeat domain-containing protein [Candidatus Obscuribacterales bacterium]
MTDLQQLYIELLGHESESVREEAVKALLDMIDAEVVEALLEIVTQPEHNGQLEAIWLLGKSEETQVTEALLQLFQSPDAQVREVVAGAFAEIGDVRALQPLIDALNDESPNVKDAAAIALGELRDSRAIKPLIAKLGETPVQQVAAWALAMIGDKRAVAPLTEAMLTDEDASMRGMAARALGKLGHADADQAVIAGLDDSEESVLIEVIRVLGERRCAAAIPRLEEMFRTTEMDRVKLACAVALARSGQGRDHFEFLLATLQGDEDWGARLSSIMGMREMDYELVEEPLRKALDDTHWLVQKSAARSLLQLQDEELYTTLETYLGDEEEDIMQAVIETSFYELLEAGDDEEE